MQMSTGDIDWQREDMEMKPRGDSNVIQKEVLVHREVHSCVEMPARKIYQVMH